MVKVGGIKFSLRDGFDLPARVKAEFLFFNLKLEYHGTHK